MYVKYTKEWSPGENITRQNALMELLFDFDATALETDVAEVDMVGRLESLDPQVDDWDLTDI